jgi:hypothetical protein
MEDPHMPSLNEQSPRGRIARAFERRLGKRYQQFIFWRAMRRFLREVPEASRGFDPALLEELVRGWGDTGSGQHDYLAACLQQVRETDGPVLECGSGLSTVLMGAVAQARGIRMYSLEHQTRSATRVQKCLSKYRIHSVTVCTAPIRSFGDFDWYSLPALQSVPPRISLVICDGPTGGTRGGRYGLVPVMMEKLRSDCVILLGDGAGEVARSITQRWGQMLGGNPELIGKEKPFIRLIAGRTKDPLHTAPIAENPSLEDQPPAGIGQPERA